jgi:mono/diheme cytochrome c family protein/predicted negative regulator of RcsB-dependent stress response
MHTSDSSAAEHSDHVGATSPRRGRWLLLALIAAALLFAVAGTVWYWPTVTASRLLRAAEEHLAAGEIGPAWRAATEAARITPRDYRPELLRARCALSWQEPELWRQALDAAAAKELPETERRLYEALGVAAFSGEEPLKPADVARLIDLGAKPTDAATAVVDGLLARGNPAAAEEALASVPSDRVDEAHLQALRGQVAAARGQRQLAADAFHAALAKQAGHERAQGGLARLAEELYELAEALELVSQLYASAPDRETSRVNLARILRKLGRLDEARKILAAPDLPAEASVAVALERGEIEYEAGDYPLAAEWFDRADLAGPHIAETLRAAASNLAQAGQREASQALFARIDDAQGQSRLQSELSRRLSIDPGDAAAATELELLASRGSLTGSRQPAAIVPGATSHQQALYIEHCAACHGDDGGGNGRAAQHLFPRPRDLRQDAYRLISTTSLAPTRDDINLVIRQGIPGTSMRAFDKLTEEDRFALAEYVLLLRSVGRAERLEGSAPENPASVEPLVMPEFGLADEQVLARGRELYVETGCAKCHGNDGTGADSPPLVDDEGRPTLARDLVHDPMKGGASLESLYRRIRLGMPGTPHPAAATLAEPDLVALVHYCHSIGQEPKRQLTNHERSLRAARGGNPAATAD